MFKIQIWELYSRDSDWIGLSHWARSLCMHTKGPEMTVTYMEYGAEGFYQHVEGCRVFTASKLLSLPLFHLLSTLVKLIQMKAPFRRTSSVLETYRIKVCEKVANVSS